MAATDPTVTEQVDDYTDLREVLNREQMVRLAVVQELHETGITDVEELQVLALFVAAGRPVTFAPVQVPQLRPLATERQTAPLYEQTVAAQQ